MSIILYKREYRRLVATADGALWVGTETGHIPQFHWGRWQKTNLPQDDSPQAVRRISLVSDNEILIGSVRSNDSGATKTAR